MQVYKYLVCRKFCVDAYKICYIYNNVKEMHDLNCFLNAISS